MKLLFALLLIAIAAAQAVDPTDLVEKRNEWDDYKIKYNKHYETDEEDQRRMKIYFDKKKIIDEHNAKFAKGEVTYQMGVNQYTDMYPDEVPTGLLTAEKKEWMDYKVKYNKHYETDEEDQRRMKIYFDKKKIIDEHNAKFAKGEVTYQMGVNQYTDMHPDEVPTGLLTAEKKEWMDYKIKYNKHYETDEEDQRRMKIYFDKKKIIDEHNAKFAKGEVTYQMGVNQFTDMRPEEVPKGSSTKQEKQ